jgi:hypothetical protein
VKSRSAASALAACRITRMWAVEAGMRTRTRSDTEHRFYPGAPRSLLHWVAVFRRRPRPSLDPEAAAGAAAFRRTLDDVERAKQSLVAAVPRGRGAGVPLAEALAGFEVGLADARAASASWRSEAVEPEWRLCEDALTESERRAELLRLEASPEGYEELAPLLAELMEPLEAFEAALARFRGLGA